MRLGADKPDAFFGFTQDRRHQPNGTRLAFWAETREEVDRLARLVRKIGGKMPGRSGGLSRPTAAAIMPAFFEDPDGNKLEICAGESPIIPG